MQKFQKHLTQINLFIFDEIYFRPAGTEICFAFRTQGLSENIRPSILKKLCNLIFTFIKNTKFI